MVVAARPHRHRRLAKINLLIEGAFCKSLTRLCHVCYIDTLLLGHEAEEGEDDEPRKNGGAGVDGADDQGVLVYVVMVLVVRAEGNDGAKPKAVGEEDLGGSVNPYPGVAQLREVGHQVEVDAVGGAL